MEPSPFEFVCFNIEEEPISTNTNLAINKILELNVPISHGREIKDVGEDSNTVNNRKVISFIKVKEESTVRVGSNWTNEYFLHGNAKIKDEEIESDNSVEGVNIECDPNFKEPELKCEMEDTEVVGGINTGSNDKLYKCHDRDKSYRNVQSSVYHQSSKHLNLRPFKCPDCLVSFAKNSTMKCHRDLVHLKLFSFKCSNCDKAHYRQVNLIEHQRSQHLQVECFKCKDCDSSFCKKINLQYHRMAHHLNQMPHKCPGCHKLFINREYLKRHQETEHPKIKPYSCPQCGNGYCMETNLIHHQMVEHLKIKPYKCYDCGKCFIVEGQLKTHRDTVHCKLDSNVFTDNVGNETDRASSQVSGTGGDTENSGDVVGAAIKREPLELNVAETEVVVDNKTNRKNRRRPRTKNKNKITEGEYDSLLQEMRACDKETFFMYTNMNVDQFDKLLSIVGPLIKKKSNREYIPEGVRLALTLRHLVAGNSLTIIASAFKIGESTARIIVKETCNALWASLNPLYLQEPDENKWKEISQAFANNCNLPNCLGALEAKHIRIKCADDTFSTVLFAVIDSNCDFIYIDIDAYKNQSNGGIFNISTFGQRLEANTLKIPEDDLLPGTNQGFPFYYVGDEEFPLTARLMRPYSWRNMTKCAKIFDCRLAIARRCAENAFAMLTARFKIFHKVIEAQAQTVNSFVRAAVCLHNFLKKVEFEVPPCDRRYCPPSYADSDVGGNVSKRNWHEEVPLNQVMQPTTYVRRLGARNSTISAMAVRDGLMDYFLSEQGKLPWQDEII